MSSTGFLRKGNIILCNFLKDHAWIKVIERAQKPKNLTLCLKAKSFILLSVMNWQSAMKSLKVVVYKFYKLSIEKSMLKFYYINVIGWLHWLPITCCCRFKKKLIQRSLARDFQPCIFLTKSYYATFTWRLPFWKFYL